jgi:hypothetical protein
MFSRLHRAVNKSPDTPIDSGGRARPIPEFLPLLPRADGGALVAL